MRLRMITYWTFWRCLKALNYIATVVTMPLYFFFSSEHLSALDILKKILVSVFVLFFYLSYLAEKE